MDILIKEVTYFITLAENLNISKAAEVLGIQQSGLSRALQRLETDFGHKLFQRKNSGLSLTESGKQFLAAVKNTKTSWEQNFRRIVSDMDEPSGLIKIGFHPSFGQKYFPGVVLAISNHFPQVEIEAYALSSVEVTRKVNQQELDFGIVSSKIKNAELIQKKIGSDFLAAYQKDKDKIPTRIILNPEMQSALPIIRKHSDTKKIVIKDYDIIAKTALTGNYMALLPDSVAKNYPLLKQVSGAYLKADISIISHTEKISLKAYRKLFEIIKEACQLA